MTNVELLPLPPARLVIKHDIGPISETEPFWNKRDVSDYARARVAHATAALNTEIEALRAEAGLLRHGNIAYSQQVADLIGRAGCAEARAERLAEAERWRAVREMDGGAIYAVLGDCDGMHPELADAAIDHARGKGIVPEQGEGDRG